MFIFTLFLYPVTFLKKDVLSENGNIIQKSKSSVLELIVSISDPVSKDLSMNSAASQFYGLLIIHHKY